MPENNLANWGPTWHPSAMKIRAISLRAIRTFFDERGYTEVTTPVLSRDVVVDAHLHPFSVVDSPSNEKLYLQTSPEAAMKRLLAWGSGSIFQIGPAFRSSEQGTRHNSEFTMVEWYGVASTDADQKILTEQLVKTIQRTVWEFCDESKDILPWKPLDLLTEPFLQTSYEAAFRKLTSDSILELPTVDLRTLCVETCNFVVADDVCRDDLLNILLAEHVEPALGISVPEFLHSYPISQSALAQASVDDSRTCRRFELYINGLEICNGYHELTDSEELHRRTQAENNKRAAEKTASLPGAPRLEAAMQHGLPECSGVALGFDRLLMALLRETNIHQLLPFPFDIA